MKIVLAPDSFKGTLSSAEISETLKNVLTKNNDKITVESLPVADGGEGITECFEKITGGEKIFATVTGPNFQKVKGYFLLCGDTAVIESACAAGLSLADPTDAKSTTTYGVGELIKEAVNHGVKKIILGLGGSATNDCGAGMAAALGTEFYNEKGEKFIPVGKTLKDIKKIKFSEKSHIKFTALCDVKNPLYGENGAAYIYAKQKGATDEEIKLLDDGLRHIGKVIEEYGVNVSEIPGGGAAGGMGAGVVAFLGGNLERGIDVVLDEMNFEEKVKDADYIITGEGSVDSQSFCGKVIDGIIARKGNAKVIAVAGISKIDNCRKYGLEKIFETNYNHLPFEKIKKTAHEDLVQCAEKVKEYLLKQI